jgi:hypothetical protein
MVLYALLVVKLSAAIIVAEEKQTQLIAANHIFKGKKMPFPY